MLDNKKVGKNILTLRKRLEMTQVELSNLLGVSHQAVSKWEQGECLPDVGILLRLARIFDKSVEELLLVERHHSQGAKSLNQDSSDIWGNVLEEIKKQLSIPSFNTWFKHTSAKYEGDSLIIYCPNDFTKEWLSVRYTSLITKALNKLIGDSKIRIIFQTGL